jgi:esterase/lipase superfamily enzyme
MSNLTFDEGLIREHTPEPLEGHTVVVLERVGESGEKFHSLLKPGDELPWQITLAASLRRPHLYFAFAVETSRVHRLTFSERVAMPNRPDALEVQFTLLSRVAVPRLLVSTRESDPLKRVRDRVAEVVASEAGALDWRPVRDSSDAVTASVPPSTRADLQAFAERYGIHILELQIRTNAPDLSREDLRITRSDPEELSLKTDDAVESAAVPEKHRPQGQPRPPKNGGGMGSFSSSAGFSAPASGPPEASPEAWPDASPEEWPDASPEAPPEAWPDASPGASSEASEAPPSPAEDGDVLYRVWYGTNRRPTGTGAKLSYSGRVDERVHLGSCDVVIPSTHRMGELGSPWIRRFLTRTDDRLRVQTITPLEAEDFWSGVRDVATSYRADERHALVFIHGYRVSFKDAALRAAQLGYDLGVRGPVAFFSWPSRATVFGYPADGSAVEDSEREITDFLIQFAQNCGAERVHVVAHSMGNRPLLRALQRILATADLVPAVRFGHLILAAPDVTRGLFLDVADQYRRMAQRTTLYVSDKDEALRASFRMQGDRVGLAPPVTCAEGIDTIHVGKVNRTMLGHSTFAEARPVLEDIRHLLNYNASPQARGLTPHRQGSEEYWSIRA